MMTVLSMSIVVAPTAKAAAAAGDLIKTSTSSSVYYLGTNMKKYVFPNAATYFSWYKDFSGVVTISQSEMDSYGLPVGNVTVRPGTKLVKSPSVNTVYAVEPNGTLRSIVSEANAISLWGAGWAKKVIDLPDSFIVNYIPGTPLAVGQYPVGQLIKTSGSSDVMLVAADGTVRKFATEAAFNANNYSFDYVETVPSTYTMPTTGAVVSGSETGLSNVAQSGAVVGPVVGGSGISVALASDTAAAASIATNAPSDFLKFNITASNDGAATVSSIKLTSGGLGAGSEVDNVTLYVDGARVGTAKNIDSNREAVFNFSSGIAIPAGQTKAVIVRASVTGTNQYNLGIAKAADITTTGATISGSFPITGNIMSGVSLVVGNLTATHVTDPADVKLGDKEAIIGSLKLANDNSKEDIAISSITLKKTDGSATDASFENVGLYVNGTKVASSLGLKDKYVTFNFTTPYVIKKDNNKTFEVKADIIDGASKDITLSLDSSSDISAIGSVYGTYAKITASTPLDISVDVNINAGAVALAKVQPAIEKVRNNTTNVVLGTMKITPTTGKPAELRTLIVTIATSTGVDQADIENVEVMDASTGLVYELTNSAATKYSNTSVGLWLTSGVTKELVVRMDIADTASDGDTFAASINNAATDLLLYDEDNVAVTDITPSSITFNTITVQQPALTISVSPLSAALTAVAGTTDVPVLVFNLKANATDALKVTQIVIDETGSTDISSSKLSQVRLYKDGETTALKAVSGSNVDDTITFSGLNINVPAGQEVKYVVTADITSGATGDCTWTIGAEPTVEDVTEGNALTVALGTIIGYTHQMTSGRTVTFATAGSLIISMDNTTTDTVKNTYQLAGNTTGILAAINLKASKEDVKITDLAIEQFDLGKAANVTNAPKMWKSLTLLDSNMTTVIATLNSVAASSTFTGLSLIVPQTTKTVYLKGVSNNIVKDGVGIVNASTTFNVSDVIARGVGSGAALSSNATSSVATASCADQTICYVVPAGSPSQGVGGYPGHNTYKTATSTTATVLASKISSVGLVSSGDGCTLSSSLSAGENTVAIIKVTTDNTGANTLSDGSTIKTVLNTIVIDYNITGATSSHISIEKCGGTEAHVNGDAVIDDGDTSGNTLFDMSGMTNENKISSASTVYYAVKFTIPTVSATAGASTVQIDLANLDSNTSGTANFKWQDSSDANNKYALLLSSNKVTGTKIAN